MQIMHRWVGRRGTLAITCPQNAGASGNSLGFGELKGAGQVHGRVSQASTQRTSHAEQPEARSG
jgi:hypothetical protein